MMNASRRAFARYQRRCQLWHAHRLLCRDYAEFRQHLSRIELAVAAQLRTEFPELAQGRS